MRVLLVVDTPNWAIDYLAQSIIKHAPHHTYECVYVPPRDAGELEVQQKFERDVREFRPDIIHFMYYRSCSQLIEALPFLKKYKMILSHQNQRDKALYHKDWNALGIDCITTATQKAAMLLMQRGQNNVRAIKYGVEFDDFPFIEDEPKEFVCGYVGRVVQWKNLVIIGEACHEIGVPLRMMGRMNKPEYYNEMSDEVRANINTEFIDCKDEERKDFFKEISCYVGFSRDGYEEGTLGYLEAMASGVPVVTSPSGMADDLGVDNDNCMIVPFEDKEKLKEAILKVKNDDELRKKLKKNGWNIIKNYPIARYAHEYSKLYYELGGDEFPLVSVIIPATYDRQNEVVAITKALYENNYPNFELVVIWDEEYKPEIDVNLKVKFPVKQLWTEKEGYNLAMARNMGVIEAEGEILMFCDSRLKPDPDCITMFQQAIEHAGEITMGGNKKIWYFGDKGSMKKSFVENFSAVKRNSFIEFGMCNERIDEYGGMSQELRTRWVKQGGQFTFLSQAKCEEMTSSKMTSSKRSQIINMKLKLIKMYDNTRY